MHLSSIQIEQFNQDGFLFFPSLFSFDEIKVLNNEAERLFGLDREENFREKDGKTVRTILVLIFIVSHMQSYQDTQGYYNPLWIF